MEIYIVILGGRNMKSKEEKMYKFGFYCLNAFICIYSLYIFIFYQKLSQVSEILFSLTFVVDAIMYYIKRKN